MKSELHLSDPDANRAQPIPVGSDSHPSIDVMQALVGIHVLMIGPIHPGTVLDRLLRSFVKELRLHLPYDYSDAYGVSSDLEISE